MHSRLPLALLVLSMAVAVGLGAAWFPLNENPGRADAGGYRLNLLLTPSGAIENDWYGNGIRNARQTVHALSFSTGTASPQIFTRPLAVYAGRCYVATIRTEVRGTGSLALLVTDEDMKTVLRQRQIETAGSTTTRLVFDSGEYRRITLVLAGRSGIAVSVTSASLLPAPSTACSS